MSKLTKEDLRHLIPHSGAMCLVDSVLRWTETDIVCTTRCHQDALNPLMTEGILPAICGVEIAAQAIAAHITLTSPHGSQGCTSGLLGALAGVELFTGSLHTIRGDLEIKATCLHSQQTGSIYQFVVSGEGRSLVTGRASIFIQQVAKG